MAGTSFREDNSQRLETRSGEWRVCCFPPRR